MLNYLSIFQSCKVIWSRSNYKGEKSDVNPNCFSVYHNAGVCLFILCEILASGKQFLYHISMSIILCTTTIIKKYKGNFMCNTFNEVIDVIIIGHNLLLKTCSKKTVHLQYFVYLFTWKWHRKCDIIMCCNITSIKTIYVDV